MTTGHREFISVSYRPPKRRKVDMKTRFLSLSALVVAGATAIGGVAFAPRAGSQAPAGPPPPPPSLSFSARVDTPWFPLLRGTRRVYPGLNDGKRTRELFTVPPQAKMI